MDIGESFNIRGYWWLPDSSSKRIPGELRCLRDGQIELELLGAFQETPSPQIELNFPIILGVGEDGQLITLLDNILLEKTTRSSGVPTENYQTGFLLIGAHFPRRDDLLFSAVTFRTYGLDVWIGAWCYHIENHEPRSFTMTFQPPKPREYKIDHDRRVLVHVLEQIEEGISHFSIESHAYLHLTYLHARRMEQILEDVRKVKDLITFSIGRPVALQEMSLVPPHDEAMEEYVRTIKLYFPSLPGPQGGFTVLHKIFSLKDIEADFGSLVGRWLKLYDRIEPALTLYFAIQYQESYVEIEFLSLVQCLEALHRRFFTNEVEPEALHRKRVTRILEGLSKEDREWLQPRLQYSNEPALRQRLEELISSFEDLYGTAQDRKKFIQSVVVTRNYLTHYDERLRNQSLRDEQLVNASHKLQLLFVLQMLQLLGFDSEQIRKMVRRSPRFRATIEG